MSDTKTIQTNENPNNVTWLKPADPTDPTVMKASVAFECCKDVCLAMSDFEDQ